MRNAQDVRVVLIGGEKGGTGKSTIATNMAIMSKMMGHDTILIDTDKLQATSFGFIEKRKEKNLSPIPFCTILKGKHLHEELKDFADKYEIVIIDSGGQDSPELRSALASPVLQSIYSPLKPSQFDLDTVSTMDDLVDIAKSFNPDLEAYLIFNQASTHSKINDAQDAIEYCKDLENITVCDVVLYHRIAYQYAASNSQCVVEFELERRNKLLPYQAKKFVPQASLELCKLYSSIFKREFKNPFTDEYKSLQINKETI